MKKFNHLLKNILCFVFSAVFGLLSFGQKDSVNNYFGDYIIIRNGVVPFNLEITCDTYGIIMYEGINRVKNDRTSMSDFILIKYDYSGPCVYANDTLTLILNGNIFMSIKILDTLSLVVLNSKFDQCNLDTLYRVEAQICATDGPYLRWIYTFYSQKETIIIPMSDIDDVLDFPIYPTWTFFSPTTTIEKQCKDTSFIHPLLQKVLR